MNKTADTLEHVRSDARNLHEKIAEALTKNEAARRKDLQEAGDKAQQIASSVRTLAKERHSEATANFTNAAASLESAAASAKETGKARVADLREHNDAMLTQVRSALKNLSSARAAERSSTAKPL